MHDVDDSMHSFIYRSMHAGCSRWPQYHAKHMQDAWHHSAQRRMPWCLRHVQTDTTLGSKAACTPSLPLPCAPPPHTRTLVGLVKQLCRQQPAKHMHVMCQVEHREAGEARVSGITQQQQPGKEGRGKRLPSRGLGNA